MWGAFYNYSAIASLFRYLMISNMPYHCCECGIVQMEDNAACDVCGHEICETCEFTAFKHYLRLTLKPHSVKQERSIQG